MPVLDRKPCYRRTVLEEERLYYPFTKGFSSLWLMQCILALAQLLVVDRLKRYMGHCAMRDQS